MKQNLTYHALKEMLHNVPELHQATEIEPILKGYSSDLKFRVFIPGQGHFLLRTFDLSQKPLKMNEYQCVVEMKKLGVRCPLPISMGRLDEENGYMLLSYIEGEDASEALPRMNQQSQWAIGMEAGAELRKIHQFKVENQAESWYIRKGRKHQRYIEKYRQCPIKMKHDQKLLSFIEDNLDWMKHRPDGFQHDDFHPGNLVVKEGKLAGVIDFNRSDQGDPVHEFLKLGLFASEASIPYSMGQIQGYFGGGEPGELFWKLYSLYTAMALVSSVVWIQQVKPEETDDMMDKIERVREDHDDFRRFIPRWYSLKNQ
ncbi:aminoglycoside phosphotransferase family protein [Paenibacillus xylanilyticus]|uniref:aminoglycoside phosphotransferase family protein n=1 Tax=Paenibacillus xylanilyticus TaxID=248903 RepID=UPI0039A13F41